ncbi:MAG: hypothetical protein ACI92G_000803 [Candidatus Pelagisphaera sp.]|jgi:hypothetical protein
MTIYKQLMFAGCSLLLSITQALSQGLNFDAGSDGSAGAINITVSEQYVLPADGIIHATTVNVDVGAILTFKRNDFNTPVYLLATGNVTINGVINVNGAAGSDSIGGSSGPGGFDGGNPGSSGVSPGDGMGPGGGKAGDNNTGVTSAGSGSYASQATSGSSPGEGALYGSPLLIPIIGGSGGAGTTGVPGKGGGGGGGAVLIASDTQIELSSTGDITAHGGRYYSSAHNGGSGGSVRLVAPKVFGAGEIRAESRRSDNALSGSTYAGFGRIRVDTIDRSELNPITYDPAAHTSVGSNMVVFPGPTPRLDIVEVAGAAVVLDEDQSIFVNLPFNEDPNKTVTVRAEHFNKIINVAVVLQPANGARIIVEDSIDNSGEGAATKAIAVTFPVNTQTKVFVWTIPDP